MVEMRRILCPTDFSDVSRHALEHAIVIAGWYGAEIVGLHIGPPTIVLSTAVPIPVFTPEIAPGEVDRRALEEELLGWLSAATAAGRTENQSKP